MQKAKAAGEGGLIQHQDFADAGNGDGLKLRDGGQDSELGGSEAGRFEAEVVEASDGASSATKVESGTRAGAGKVERIGGSALDCIYMSSISDLRLVSSECSRRENSPEFPADFKTWSEEAKG